jgi:hypothetical protein
MAQRRLLIPRTGIPGNLPVETHKKGFEVFVPYCAQLDSLFGDGVRPNI